MAGHACDGCVEGQQFVGTGDARVSTRLTFKQAACQRTHTTHIWRNVAEGNSLSQQLRSNWWQKKMYVRYTFTIRRRPNNSTMQIEWMTKQRISSHSFRSTSRRMDIAGMLIFVDGANVKESKCLRLCSVTGDINRRWLSHLTGFSVTVCSLNAIHFSLAGGGGVPVTECTSVCSSSSSYHSHAQTAIKSCNNSSETCGY